MSGDTSACERETLYHITFRNMKLFIPLISGLTVTDAEAEKIINLYNNLDEYDKKPLYSKLRCKASPPGKFSQKKNPCHPGVVSTSR